MLNTGFRTIAATVAVLATLAFIVVESNAAPRANVGSRGTRTFSAPSPTATAPKSAQPIERTMTQPSATAPRPAAAQPAKPAGMFGGLFNRPGLLGGLAAGFLGAGLFGLLFGHGLFGGLGGLASILGLVLQVGIVVIVAMLAWRWWQRRSQPALAGGPNFRDVAAGTPLVQLAAALHRLLPAEPINFVTVVGVKTTLPRGNPRLL